MKKQSKKKGKKERPLDLHAWVRVSTAAKYWTLLIGRIIETKGTGARAICRVSFEYRRDGTKLSKAEFMEFPRERLELVKDFSARVKKANPAPIPTPADDYEVVTPSVEAPKAQEPTAPPVDFATQRKEVIKQRWKSLSDLDASAIAADPKTEAP